ncbi:MAG: flagellar hook capping FlgD N-terminal domain-containing protein [Alphaproteobacteria bacterium]|jgi:flagellar basal-body rod modification protein FlgD|nr:flagellar hook capping FlgD N-terminal domain-containing protein [Alphaproteobacteria bacterium]
MISTVTASGQAIQAQQTVQQSVTLAEDFTQFLQLLTTQLQNQDPLSPMDSNEFTNQLVQFSQVEQAINSNSKLDDLVSLQLANAATSALGYVGLDVQYVSAEIAHVEGTPSTIRYSLESAATTSQINIFNEEGNLVFSAPAEKGVGAHEFNWSGTDFVNNPLPSGTYVVRIDSLDANDEVVETTTVVQSRVRGIEQQNGVVYALVGDRAVPITSILNAVVPPTTATNTTGTGTTTGGASG